LKKIYRKVEEVESNRRFEVEKEDLPQSRGSRISKKEGRKKWGRAPNSRGSSGSVLSNLNDNFFKFFNIFDFFNFFDFFDFVVKKFLGKLIPRRYFLGSP
jgi:hypothetical protein